MNRTSPLNSSGSNKSPWQIIHFFAAGAFGLSIFFLIFGGIVEINTVTAIGGGIMGVTLVYGLYCTRKTWKPWWPALKAKNEERRRRNEERKVRKRERLRREAGMIAVEEMGVVDGVGSPEQVHVRSW